MAATHPYADVAIVGAFNSEQARSLPGHDSLSISIVAAKGVLDATGVDIDQVDGVFGRHADQVAYSMGLGMYTTGGAASTGIATALEAANAIAAGMCHTALVLFGSAGVYTDRDATAPWTRPANEWVVPFGMYTAVEFAFIARRHMHLYGTTSEQLATVAATIRNNGSVNPGAVYYGKGPFTVDDILSSRMISDPFHLLDCSTTSEGACAVLLTTSERSKDTKLPAVRILGGGVDSLGPFYQHPPTWDLKGSRDADGIPNGYLGRRAARHAFRTAGLTPADVDVCEFYDPFSFEIIRQFEAFEFCGPGEGGEFVMDGRIGPGGRYPITTDGGTMSYSHAGQPQLLQRVARAVHQIQGLCETNQVPNASVAMCSNGGAGALFCQAMLLGKEL
jgi:acetyl-CoA acetyltransferase